MSPRSEKISRFSIPCLLQCLSPPCSPSLLGHLCHCHQSILTCRCQRRRRSRREADSHWTLPSSDSISQKWSSTLLPPHSHRIRFPPPTEMIRYSNPRPDWPYSQSRLPQYRWTRIPTRPRLSEHTSKPQRRQPRRQGIQVRGST